MIIGCRLVAVEINWKHSLDKAVVVNEDESSHQELTVHPVDHSTVTGYQVSEILCKINTVTAVSW
jgi:hypothetical protein